MADVVPKRKKHYLSEEAKKAKKESDKRRDKTRVNLGLAFTRWRALLELKGFRTDKDVAFFLLDQQCAVSAQNLDPASKTSRGRPAVTKNDIPELPANNVCVNVTCLLKLFRRCGQCSGECVLRKQGDKRSFIVIQHCPVCDLLTTWTSQPPLKEAEEAVALPFAVRGDQESTASMMARQTDGGPSGKTTFYPFAEVEVKLEVDSNFSDESQGCQEDSDGGAEAGEAAEVKLEGGIENKNIKQEEEAENKASSREDVMLTDEGVKSIRSAELEEAEKNIALPCDVREGDQESTASMFLMKTGAQSDGGPSGKTTLLAQHENKVNAEESKDTFDPLAEVERTIGSNVSDESQMSQEDSDGGEENVDNGVAAEEKGGGGVENQKEEEEEAESSEESESEEEVKSKMDDDDEDYDPSIDIVRERHARKKPIKQRPETLPIVRERHPRRNPTGRNYRNYRKKSRPETLCTDCGHMYKTFSHKCDPKKTFMCPDCGLYFVTESRLGVHRNIHCRIHSYLSCTFCLKPFKSRQDKRTHEMSHSGEEPYECPECPLRFISRLTRSQHVKEQHPKRFTCQTCQKEFPVLWLLQRHELSHTADKPFKCQMCDCMFAQASQLKSHLRVHTGERPFQCQHCAQCFNHNISLKNHTKRYHQAESHDNPALGEQGEGYHGPEPGAEKVQAAGES